MLVFDFSLMISRLNAGYLMNVSWLFQFISFGTESTIWYLVKDGTSVFTYVPRSES